MSRFLRSFWPFLLSLVVVAAANVIYEVYFRDGTQVEGQVKPVAAEVEISQIAPQQTPAPIPTAIANESARPATAEENTPAVQPTLLPGDFATLSGPPAESRFAGSSVVTLYWQSGEPLAPGQRFQVYLYGEEQEVLLRAIDEPNLGQGFQISFSPELLDLPDGQYQWQVQLYDERFETPISKSEQRSIFFFGG